MSKITKKKDYASNVLDALFLLFISTFVYKKMNRYWYDYGHIFSNLDAFSDRYKKESTNIFKKMGFEKDNYAYHIYRDTHDNDKLKLVKSFSIKENGYEASTVYNEIENLKKLVNSKHVTRMENYYFGNENIKLGNSDNIDYQEIRIYIVFSNDVSTIKYVSTLEDNVKSIKNIDETTFMLLKGLGGVHEHKVSYGGVKLSDLIVLREKDTGISRLLFANFQHSCRNMFFCNAKENKKELIRKDIFSIGKIIFDIKHKSSKTGIFQKITTFFNNAMEDGVLKLDAPNPFTDEKSRIHEDFKNEGLYKSIFMNIAEQKSLDTIIKEWMKRMKMEKDKKETKDMKIRRSRLKKKIDKCTGDDKFINKLKKLSKKLSTKRKIEDTTGDYTVFC